MKITVDISDSDLKEVCRLTGERKKGPAIRKLVTDALMLKRREKLAQKFIAGEWGVELKGFEEAQASCAASLQSLCQRGNLAVTGRRRREAGPCPIQARGAGSAGSGDLFCHPPASSQP